MLRDTQFRLRQAAHVLHGGGIVAYPTEAVWGLGCDPWNEAAVQRLLQLKVRPMEKGLILLAGDIAQFEWLLHDLEVPQHSRLELSWPGPTTWLVPHQGRVPHWVCGDFDTVALRVSAHPVAAALSRAVGGPIVSTSANVTGSRPALERYQVLRYFGDGIDYLVPGNLGGDKNPSMIRDLLSDTIVRPR